MTQAEPKRLLALVGPEQSGVELLRACLSPSSFWIPDRVTSESGWVEHAPFAFWLIEALRPHTLVELGTHGGFSYFVFCKAVQLLRLATRCYAVDTFVGDEHAGFYGEEVFTAVRTHNDQHYSAFSTLLRSSFDDALDHFSEGTIDLLHIDGRHFYEDVKHDFELWRSRLSQRSVVLFHDTNERKSGFGVFRLWKELCEVYPHFEFLHGHGLGVLGTGTELVPELHALYAASGNQVISHLREAYSSLGTAVSLALRNDDLNATVRKQAEELSRVQQEIAETRERAADAEAATAAHALASREAAALALGRSNELEQKLAAQTAAVTQLSDELASARNQSSLSETTNCVVVPESRQPKREKLTIAAIMPVYNGERFLRKAIQSVLDQTLSPHEFIIIDDRSTDGSTAIVEEMRRTYPITLIKNEKNSGQSASRNLAIRQCKSDLIALIDQDDIWYPNHLEELVKPFIRHRKGLPLGWTYSDFDDIDENGLIIARSFINRPTLQNPKRDLIQLLAQGALTQPSATLISRTAFEFVGGFDENLSGWEDEDLFLRMFRENYDNIYIRHPLSQWRIYDASSGASDRMANSQRYYILKLIAQFPDDKWRGHYYVRDIIAPRFVLIWAHMYLRSGRYKDYKRMREYAWDIWRLIPHLRIGRRIKLRMIFPVLLWPRAGEALVKAAAKYRQFIRF